MSIKLKDFNKIIEILERSQTKCDNGTPLYDEYVFQLADIIKSNRDEYFDKPTNIQLDDDFVIRWIKLYSHYPELKRQLMFDGSISDESKVSEYINNQ